MERLLKSAQRLEKMIRLDSDNITPNNVYVSLIELNSRVPYYFETFKPKEFLKLCILIYVLKKTNSFSMAGEIFRKMRFISFVVTENDSATEECYECGGSGTDSCGECDGDGIVECGECDGNGVVHCYDCGGDGTTECEDCGGDGEIDGEECSNCGGKGDFTCSDCGGEGETSCGECDGDGKTSCNYCGGDGSRDCFECDGSGEVYSDEKVNFLAIDCVSWDDEINNLCELRVNEEEPIFATDLLNSNLNTIILGQSEEVGIPEFELDNDMLYCFYFESDAKLLQNYSGRVVLNHGDDWSFYFD